MSVGACDSEVVTPDGGGGGGATGAAGGAAAAGGGACAELVPAGVSFAVDDGAGFKGHNAMGVAVTPDNWLFAGQIRPSEDAPYHSATFWYDAPWTSWPPREAARLDLPDRRLAAAAPGRVAGVALLMSGSDATLFSDVTAQGLPPGVPIEGATYGHALVTDGDYAIGVVDEIIDSTSDYGFRIVGFAGIPLAPAWERDDVGCGHTRSDKTAEPAILLSTTGGPDLIAVGDTPLGQPCTSNLDGDVGLQSRLIVLPVDREGNGEPIVIEEDLERPVATLGFVPRPEGPLLIYGRATSPSRRDYYFVALDSSGHPAGPITPLEAPTDPYGSIGVAPVEGGFMVGWQTRGDESVSAALYDLDGRLVHEAFSEPLTTDPGDGVRAVASADNKSVMLVWTQGTPDGPQGYGTLRLLRFDCVSP